MSVKKHLKYDVWIYWQLLKKCNLNCAYCYSVHYPTTSSAKKTAKIHTIDIPLLMMVLENTHKTFGIGFTGPYGEPFLTPNLVEACVEITKKHYISLTTNLTSTRVKKFAERVNPKKVIYIVASAHIKELERLNLLDTYINNFLLLKKKEFNIKAVEVAYPPLLGEVEKYRKFFSEKGIKLEFTRFIGTYNKKKYPISYTKQELRTFRLETSDVKNVYQKGTICNAGYNTAVVLPNGNIQPCFYIRKKIGNIYEKIEFRNKLTTCPFEPCGNPLKTAFPYLFEKALKQAAPLRALSRKFDRFLGEIGLFLNRNYPRLYFLIKKIKG